MKKCDICICIVLVTTLFTAFYVFAQEYSSGGKRDPFVPLLGEGRTVARQGLEGIYSINDVSLQGVIISAAGERGAIINGEVINEGEKKGVFSMEKVSDNNTVRVKIGDESFEIKLYEK